IDNNELNPARRNKVISALNFKFDQGLLSRQVANLRLDPQSSLMWLKFGIIDSNNRELA
ncbi:MAG: hypothetical protein MHPSP_002274, partial [Paramarteilia canceri]